MALPREGLVAGLAARARLEGADDRRFLAHWRGVSLLFFLIAAFCSAGHYHVDEQFQTLEFAGARLGITPEAALPWEYGLRMRPWLQPGLYVLAVGALRSVGLDDPFAWATALRLVSGLLAWTALAGLALCCGAWIDHRPSRRAAIRLVSVFCLLPVLLVRTSSESLATSAFWLAIVLFTLGVDGRERPARTTLLGVGLFLGLSFELRFPVGLMVAGFLAWAGFVRRRPARELLTVGLGAAVVVAAAALVDRWGYGEWSFPPLAFVVENLRGGRAAERFGSLPISGYLALLVRSPLAPALVPAALVTALSWVRHPRHVLTWCSVPLLLVHSLIAHKELRFLFPLLPAAAVSFGLALAPGQDRLEPLARLARGPAAGGLRRLLFGVNWIALVALPLAPLSPEAGLLRFAYRKLRHETEILVLGPSSPWGPGGLVGRFYLRPGLEVRILNAPELRQALGRGGRPRPVVVREGLRPELLDPAGGSCRALHRSVPAFLGGLPAVRPVDRWVLLECRPGPRGGE